MTQKIQDPNGISLKVGGIWGRRMKDSVAQWALKVNDGVMLECFRNRPGIQAFIGEHIGKFLLGAILVNEIADNGELWAKIDGLIPELIKCQEADGYIGTYLPGNRWKGHFNDASGVTWDTWDVWVSKYCIMALTVYHKLRGGEDALNCARGSAIY